MADSSTARGANAKFQEHRSGRAPSCAEDRDPVPHRQRVRPEMARYLPTVTLLTRRIHSMEETRLNGVIRALEGGRPAFVTFTQGEVGNAISLAETPYDGVVFEMEHNPYDIRALRDCLQYLLNRRQIARSGSIAPAVTPFVRIPPNGGELNQWVAKQVLDIGVYGVVWPHVSTVEEARNAVQACRYPRPSSAPN